LRRSRPPAPPQALATFTGPEDGGGIFLIRAVEDPGSAVPPRPRTDLTQVPLPVVLVES
jgi:hypothetical protein